MKRAFDHLIFGVLVISCMSLVVCSLEAYSQQSGQRTEFVSTDGKRRRKKAVVPFLTTPNATTSHLAVLATAAAM